MKKGRAIGWWTAGIAAAAAILALFAGLSRIAWTGATDVPASATTTVAEARALGARWRRERSDALAHDYARALVAAGLYDELLSEISERGLFSGDAPSSGLFRAEANLRQGRYAQALDAAGEAGENPFLSYARARAAYALTADATAASRDLAAALRGASDLAADAWFFRARLALDRNDVDDASAAARRAIEAGGDQARADAIAIEGLIRSGAFEEAARRIKARPSRRGASAEDLRLAAMLRLGAGDARGAVRLIDAARAAGGNHDRTRLLAALAKWNAGDIAQAYSLMNAHLAAAPRDWIALDLAAAIARDYGRKAEADALLARLGEVRPALAVVRRMRAATISSPPDQLFDALLSIDSQDVTVGAGAALLGDMARLPPLLSEPIGAEKKMIEIAGALRSGDARRMRAAIAGGDGPQEGALMLALRAAISAKLGDREAARAGFAAASAAAPDFFAPAKLSSDLFEAEGDYPGAAEPLIRFLAQHPDHAHARLALASLEARHGDDSAAARSFAAVPPSILFGDEAAALAYSRAATRAGPGPRAAMLAAARDHAPTARLLGRIGLAAGDAALASAALRAALLADPSDAALGALYLDAMTQAGRAGEARALLAEIDRRGAALAQQPSENGLKPDNSGGPTVKIPQ